MIYNLTKRKKKGERFYCALDRGAFQTSPVKLVLASFHLMTNIR